MSEKVYCPELGQEKPDTDLEAKYIYPYYFISTSLELKGRGIQKMPTGKYQVTEKAYEKLKKQYSIAIREFLD